MPSARSLTKAQEPSYQPPEEQTMSTSDDAAGQTRPNELSPAQLAKAAAKSEAAGSVPLQMPPQTTTAAATAISGTWNNSKTIDALWSINENRNSWAHVAGGNWLKMLNTSDAINQQLTLLASNAKVTQGLVNIRTEADNMIHEMYVW